MTGIQPFDPATETYISLATWRRDGREVRTPVWVATYKCRHYVFSEAKAGKVKRIRNNGRMKMAACDARGKIKSEWLEGSARIVSDISEISAMYPAFNEKYGWQMMIVNFFARLTGRYGRRAILSLEINQ